jgi:hypothetical protein
MSAPEHPLDLTAREANMDWTAMRTVGFEFSSIKLRQQRHYLVMP